MKIKRIKQLRVNDRVFNITWDKKETGASFSYYDKIIKIGARVDDIILEAILHELYEICCVEMGVRYNRTDCDSDYLFSFDHRQHTTIISMLSGLLMQFIE